MHSHHTATGGPSGMRPWVASGEVVGLGALAHLSAGGTLPGADRLLAIWLVTAAVCLALHLRLLRLTTAAALAIAGQAVVHLAGTGSGHGSHVNAMPADPANQMLLTHAVSAVATVLVLLWQESAVRAVVRLLVPVAARPTTIVMPPTRPSRAHRCRPQALRDVAVAPLRGPPMTPAPSTT